MINLLLADSAFDELAVSVSRELLVVVKLGRRHERVHHGSFPSLRSSFSSAAHKSRSLAGSTSFTPGKLTGSVSCLAFARTNELHVYCLSHVVCLKKVNNRVSLQSKIRLTLCMLKLANKTTGCQLLCACFYSATFAQAHDDQLNSTGLVDFYALTNRAAARFPLVWPNKAIMPSRAAPKRAAQTESAPSPLHRWFPRRAHNANSHNWKQQLVGGS